MPADLLTFRYTVRDAQGKTRTGTLDAPDQKAVIGKLQEMGYAPVSVERQQTSAMQKELSLPGFGKRVNARIRPAKCYGAAATGAATASSTSLAS